MTHEIIEQRQQAIKDAFKLYASVALGRINRYFEASGIEPENRVQIIDGSPKINDFDCVKFYDVANGNELPTTMLLPENLVQRVKQNQPELFGEMVSCYIDGLREDLVKSLDVVHHRPYDLAYGAKPRSDVGFGVNLPINDKTAMKIKARAAYLLTAYPLSRIEKQIEGEVSLQLPLGLIEDALIIKRMHAKSEKLSHVERRERYPEEYDLEKINNLLASVREKIVEQAQNLAEHQR